MQHIQSAISNQEAQQLSKLIVIEDFSRRKSGLTDGHAISIPYEDLEQGHREVKSVLVTLKNPHHDIDLQGLYLAIQFFFITDANEKFPQYAVKQDYEYWFSISSNSH